MKHYRNLNGCVSKMHRVIYDAYDRGYAQGRKDYERTKGSWLGMVIAKYLFCPHCGSPMSEEAYGTEEK